MIAARKLDEHRPRTALVRSCMGPRCASPTTPAAAYADVVRCSDDETSRRAGARSLAGPEQMAQLVQARQLLAQVLDQLPEKHRRVHRLGRNRATRSAGDRRLGRRARRYGRVAAARRARKIPRAARRRCALKIRSGVNRDPGSDRSARRSLVRGRSQRSAPAGAEQRALAGGETRESSRNEPTNAVLFATPEVARCEPLAIAVAAGCCAAASSSRSEPRHQRRTDHVSLSASLNAAPFRRVEAPSAALPPLPSPPVSPKLVAKPGADRRAFRACEFERRAERAQGRLERAQCGRYPGRPGRAGSLRSRAQGSKNARGSHAAQDRGALAIAGKPRPQAAWRNGSSSKIREARSSIERGRSCTSNQGGRADEYAQVDAFGGAGRWWRATASCRSTVGDGGAGADRAGASAGSAGAGGRGRRARKPQVERRKRWETRGAWRRARARCRNGGIHFAGTAG